MTNTFFQVTPNTIVKGKNYSQEYPELESIRYKRFTPRGKNPYKDKNYSELWLLEEDPPTAFTESKLVRAIDTEEAQSWFDQNQEDFIEEIDDVENPVMVDVETKEGESPKKEQKLDDDGFPVFEKKHIKYAKPLAHKFLQT